MTGPWPHMHQSTWCFCCCLLCPVFGCSLPCPVPSVPWPSCSAVLDPCHCASVPASWSQERLLCSCPKTFYFCEHCWEQWPCQTCHLNACGLQARPDYLSILCSFCVASLRNSPAAPFTRHTAPRVLSLSRIFAGLVSVQKAAGMICFQACLFESGTGFVYCTNLLHPPCGSVLSLIPCPRGWLWPLAAVQFGSLSLCASFLCMLCFWGVKMRNFCWFFFFFLGIWWLFWTSKILASPSIRLNRIMTWAISVGS